MTTWNLIEALAETVTTPLIVALFLLIAYRQHQGLAEEMRAKLRGMGFHYYWGMFSSGVNGAALAIKGTLGVAAGAAFNPQQVQAPNPTIIIYLFGVAFVLNAIDWLTKNPLPTTFSMPPFATQRQVDEGTSRSTMVSPATLAALPAVKAADEQLPKT